MNAPVELRGKRRLEQAVNNVGRHINKLAAVFEKHGRELTTEELEKAFTYLGVLLASAQQKAQVAQAHVARIGDSFSLDAPLATPLPPMVQDGKGPRTKVPTKEVSEHIADILAKKAPPPAPSEDDDIDFVDDDEIEAIAARAETLEARHDPESVTPARPVGRRRAVGRLVHTKEPVFTFDEPEKKKPTPPEAGEVPDKTGYLDAGFIED